MSALVLDPPTTTDPASGTALDAPPAPADRGRAWLAALFAGDFTFPAVAAAPLPPAERTAAEHDAVSRAAGCRDLFVLHADPFTGERLIADLARATADRVLVLSPNSVSADRIAERLLKCGATVLRALAEDENPARPAPAVNRATSAALGAGRAEQAKRETAAEVAAAEKRLAAFAPVAKVVARLDEVNATLATLDAVVAESTALRDRVGSDVRAETDTPLAAALAALASDHTEKTARLTAELRAATAAHTEKAAALAAVRDHLAETLRKPGFFGRWFGGKPKPGAPDPADAEKQVHALETEVAGLASRVAELQKQADTATAAHASQREQIVEKEIATRRAACEAALTAAESDRARARAEAAALNKAISAAVPGEDHAAATRTLAAAGARAAEVAASTREALTRALTEPRVVVGTPGCLGADPVFAALAQANDPPFGLLVLDRAEELPESEFPRLARFAARRVLVGDALPPASRAPRNGRPNEAPFVARVAKTLDRETWAPEGDRLVCRLVHLTPQQRRAITHEPLADRPEIELRFAATDDDPVLAEIAFPGRVAVPDAKSFLFHALGEVLLRPCGDVVWAHEPDAITATWPAAGTDRAAVWIDLETGVREQIAGTGLFAYTAAVRFDPAAGWDAERAAAWLAKHLPPPAPGRFLALPRSNSRPV